MRYCQSTTEPDSLLLRNSRPMFRFQLLLNSAIVTFLGITTPGVAPASQAPAGQVELNGNNAQTGDAATNKAREKFFHTKVLPLLQARCFECHERSEDQTEIDDLGGALLLSSRKAMLVGGETGPAIVPGSPDESLMIQAIRYDGYEMPPRSRMPAEEIQILETWVKEGAYFPKGLDAAPEFRVSKFPLEERAEDHWAWHFDPNAIRVPTDEQGEWAKTDIDRFVVKTLNEHALKPAPDADRATLIRRLSFDITGLPPTIGEINTFTQDPRPTEDAVMTVVDRLLASPAFGEHWGRHWLDLVRYADTLGHEFDYPLHEAWRYRDYVIRAFNEDVPYDQFVKEHLAGDLVAVPRRHSKQNFNESIIGTGFWFLHENKHAPVDVRGEEAAIIDNQIDVFSKTFLGMTLACARCHDHKFDAISTADYYAMAGYLQSSRRQSAWLDPDLEIKQQLSQVAEFKATAIDRLDQLASPQAIRKQTATYLAAAIQALNEEVPSAVELVKRDPETTRSANSDVLFADFEGDSFGMSDADPWIVQGDAFAKGPIAGAGGPAQKISGMQGQRTANSYLGTDSITGTLISPPFVIRNSGISFLVAGGSLAEKVSVNLLIDGKVVRSAAGNRSDRLKSHHWPVEDFIGKTAVLKIDDQARGGWGHIIVDEIRFVNEDSTLPIVRDVNQLADHFALDRAVLKKWVRILHGAELKSTPSALQNALKFAQACTKQPLHQTMAKFAGAVSRGPRSRDQSVEITTVIGDFSSGVPEGWRTSGQSFLAEPDNVGVLWQDGQPTFERHCVSSASLSVKQRGSLFSPTFTLDGDQVLVHIAGKAAGLRLVIDGYIMHEFTPLLFQGTKVDVNTEAEFRWVSLAGDIGRYAGHRAYLEIRDDSDGWFAVRQVVMPKPGQAAVVKKLLSEPPGFVSTANVSGSADAAKANLLACIESLIPDSKGAARSQQSWLLRQGLLSLPRRQLIDETLSQWVSQAENVSAPMKVMAMMDGSPENERVFIRGNHKSLGDEVPRNILTALQRNQTTTETKAQGSGRLELAERLVERQNPLTSRVAVNRIWHHLFGNGLVSSTDNFGVLGTQPSHPDLLDYLAVQFMDQGWLMKSMIREMVLSRSYRMQSQASAHAEQIDPTNRYLHRARIRRLSAESIRDSMLLVAGELKDQQFGSPVPIHLTAFMQGRGRPGTDGLLDGSGRRSIYLKINRNFLSPIMTAFDAPTPFTTIGRRNVSNVPAQALILLNNEFVTEMANRWADKLQAEQTTTPQKVSKAWQQLYGFQPTDDELAPLMQYVADAGGKDDEVAILSDLLHALFNGKQFLYLR